MESGSLYVVTKDLCLSAIILKTLRLFMYVQPIYVWILPFIAFKAIW